MKESDPMDNLNILTKSEIIDLVKRKYIIGPISKREIYFYKWEIEHKKLKIKMDLHLSKSDEFSEIAKESDRLAELFNKESDPKAWIELLNKINQLRSKIISHNREYSNLSKKYEEIDRIYYDIG